jgi:hypothetical protein
MNLIDIIIDMIEEHGYSTATNRNRSYITFNLKPGLTHYRATVDGLSTYFTRVLLRSNSRNGKTFFIPEHEKLLSVDLHDPTSFEVIRSWLKTLR